MTIEQAEHIRRLLEVRADLISRKKELEDCTCISGEISDGYNGRAFTWTKLDREIGHIIHGLTKDIASLTETITNLHIEGEGI